MASIMADLPNQLIMVIIREATREAALRAPVLHELRARATNRPLLEEIYRMLHEELNMVAPGWDPDDYEEGDEEAEFENWVNWSEKPVRDIISRVYYFRGHDRISPSPFAYTRRPY